MPNRAATRAMALRMVLLLLNARAVGQTTVRGIVLDTAGGVVVGAEVSITSAVGTQRSVTSANGRFSFDNVAPPAKVMASRKGFAPATMEWPGGSDLRLVLSPAPIEQQVVVTATRTPATLAEVASSVSAITAAEAASAPELAIDDVLRQVPGFSLLRRSDSRTANPTSQGVSLRGLGASGASRALVLLDGVPLNDPFGGWVYWDRIPTAAIGRVEVLRSGGAALYGSGALAGVVNAETRAVADRALVVDTTAGNQNTESASVAAFQRWQDWGVSTAVQALQTDGYIPAPASQRGRADAPANEHYATGRMRLERHFGFGSGFVAVNLFNESRENGTAVQRNSTRLVELAAGADTTVLGGTLTLRVYGSAQRFNQSFSSVSADRNTETLLRWQAVPAQQAGGSAQWVRPLGSRNVLVAGGDARQVRGDSDEVGFTRAAPSSRAIGGGHQIATGGFVEDIAQVGARVHLTSAVRVDSWKNYDALSTTLQLAPPFSSSQTRFPERGETEVSPSLGAAVQVSRLVSIRGAGYGSFRAPTLNELYRGFRLGNVQTLANDALQAERLWGGEAGVTVGSGPLFARATFFRNEIHDAVGNRTLSTTPTLITRQRQNIGTLDARGVEFEVQGKLPRRTWARLGYEFVDSTVAHSLDATLAGLRIPQVPRHTTSLTLGYSGRRWDASIAGRYVGRQFDDDLNVFPLPGYFGADASLRYNIRERAEVFVAAENIFDRSYAVALTPTEQVGAPRLVRAGVRLTLGPRVR